MIISILIIGRHMWDWNWICQISSNRVDRWWSWSGQAYALLPQFPSLVYIFHIPCLQFYSTHQLLSIRISFGIRVSVIAVPRYDLFGILIFAMWVDNSVILCLKIMPKGPVWRSWILDDCAECWYVFLVFLYRWKYGWQWEWWAQTQTGTQVEWENPFIYVEEICCCSSVAWSWDR